MALDPNVILDRRRLKRRLFIWRTLAIAALAGVGLAAYAVEQGGWDKAFGGEDRIARINIAGFIAPDRRVLEMIAKLAKDDHVKGVIVTLNTPGGSTAAGEALSEAIRELAAKKPTVAQIDALAASAGYMVAVSTDHIVARRNALTGSIGVLMQWPDASKLLDSVGVKYEEVKSSPMKAEPTPFKPISAEARAMLDLTIRDSYDRFVAQVAERRNMDPARARELGDGRVVTGAMAKELNLVDSLGGEAVALDWLATKGVDRTLKVVDAKPSGDGRWRALTGESFAAAIIRGTASAFGFNLPARAEGELDGLLSVWHADGSGNAR